MKRTLSKVITVVVMLAMVISLLATPASAITWDNVSETRYASRYITSDYATGKFYRNMTQIPLTGDGRRDVVAVAASQMGYIEGDSASGYDGETGGSANYTEYGYYMGINGAWCAAFCAWSFYVAEVTDVDGYGNETNSGNIWADTYVPDWSGYMMNQGRYKAAYQFRNDYSSYYDASYIPQPGDLVFFCTASGDYPGWEGHIGLVAYSDGTYVYTLEGNTSSQQGVESEGGGAFFKKYDLKGTSLCGFGVMPYETVDGLPEIDYTGANPTPGLYVTPTGSVPVYLGIDDTTASWTLPMSSVFEVSEIATASDGYVMLHAKCEINGTTVYGWIPHGSDSNGYTKTLQVYASTELEIPESYGPSQDAEGNYSFENAYGYVFDIDDVDGDINGGDATLITSVSAYEDCNPDWAISVQLRPTGNDGEYSVVKVVVTPGSAANAGIELADGDKILVVHSNGSKPPYANWMDKVAAQALKEGDYITISSDNKTATVNGPGELPEDPNPDPDPEPTEPDPEPTEPEETMPDLVLPGAEMPDYGGAIPGAGQQGNTAHVAEGCDVSFYNVNDTSYSASNPTDSGADYSLLDFERMKADGCDFVILRMGSEDSSGKYTDPHFFTLYNMAREAGLDIGLYYYSYAMNQSEAIAEANYVISVLNANDMYFEYPIYIDIEESDQLALGETTLSNICYGWCDTMYNAGYYPGIYGNYNLYDAISTQVKNDYDFWLAWVSSTTSMSAYSPSTHNVSNEAAMWQYSFYGYEYDGVGLDMLDVNVAYKDYPSIMAAGGYNNIPKAVGATIPGKYGPSMDEDGNISLENAYDYVFNIDDVNGVIDGGDITLITDTSKYASCNPNWAISVQLRPVCDGSKYEVVKVAVGNGSVPAFTLEEDDVILVVHSAGSNPEFANWMSKVAAMALKEGDVVVISADQTTATAMKPGNAHSFTNKQGTLKTDGTCMDEAVYAVQCDNCDAESETLTVKGEKDPDNHTSEAFTYTDNGDGATHTKAHACCNAVVETEEAHDYVDGKCACGADEPTTEGLKGDLDLDGDVDAADLTMLARHVGGIELLSGQALKNADVNGDGDVDASDLTLHARYVGGIITSWDEE